MVKSEGSYTVWYREKGTTEWHPDTNHLGMVHAQSLNSAIKAERFYQRMRGYETMRKYNDKI